MDNSRPFDKLLYILEQLKDGNISCSLRYCREDAIRIYATVPGQRWEIEVFSNGSVEVEIYESDGSISDERKLRELITDYSD